MTAADAPKERGSKQNWLGAVGALLLAAWVAISFAYVPLRTSQDEWWHLKAGQWMAQHGERPTYDIFTYTGERTVWHNHEWLAQVGMWRLWAWGQGVDARAPMGPEHLRDGGVDGWRAVITAKALLYAAAMMLVVLMARAQWRSWVLAALIGVVAAEIGRRTTAPRPPVISYVFFASYLLLLLQWKRGRVHGAWLWATVPLTVLWANLHGMCLLAIVCVGSYAAGEFAENAWRAVAPERLRRAMGPLAGRARGGSATLVRAVVTPRLFMLGALTVAQVLAVAMSPSGWEMFGLGAKFTKDAYLKGAIAEMLPPPFFVQQGMVIPGHMTFWIWVTLAAVLLVVSRLRLRFGADYVLVGFFAFQALNHWRLLPLFAIASAGPMAFLLGRAAMSLSGRRIGVVRLMRLATAGVAVVLSAGLVFALGEPPPQTFFRRNVMLWRGAPMDPASYPERLMRFLIDAKLPGRMFSDSNYCGYFMWRLAPEHYKLFTDNRFDIWSSEFIIPEKMVIEAKERDDRFRSAPDELQTMSWRDVLDRFGINFVVLSRGSRLHERLNREGDASGWAQVYNYLPNRAQDVGNPQAGFAVYVRALPEHAAVIARAKELAARY